MKPAPDVYERNLRALLKRAQPRLDIDPAFRARLERRIVERSVERAAARVEPALRAQRAWTRGLALAAALLALIGAALWSLWPSGGGAEPSEQRGGGARVAQQDERDAPGGTVVDGQRPLAAEPDPTAGGASAARSLDQVPQPGLQRAEAAGAAEPGSAAESAADGDGVADGAPAEQSDGEAHDGPLGEALAAALLLQVELPDGAEPPARLELVLLRQVGLPNVPMPEFHTAELVESHARVEGLLAGEYELYARADGYAMWRLPSLRLDAGEEREFELVLERGRAVSGRVLDSDGLPLAGAAVISQTGLPLAVCAPGVDQARNLGAPWTLTNEAGEFVLENAGRGALELRADALGHGPVWASVAPAAEDRTAAAPALELSLPAEARVAGRVLDADGSPRTDAQVLISFNGPDQRPRYYNEVLVDATGAFDLGQLPEELGIALVFAIELPEGPPLAFRSLRCAAGERQTLDLRIGGGAWPSAALPQPHEPGDTPATLAGRLIDAEAQPVRGRAIFAHRADSDGRALPDVGWSAGLTDEAGRFVLADLPPGHIALFSSDDVTKSLLHLESFEVAPGERRTAEYRIGTSQLDCRLLGPDAEQPIELLAALLWTRVEGEAQPRLVARSIPDSEGRLILRDLGPGPWRLDLIPANAAFAMSSIEELRLEPGPNSVELAALAGGRLELELRDAAGAPLAGERIGLVDPGGRMAFFDWQPLTSDAQGRAAVERLAPGSWSVRTEPSGLSARVSILPGRSSTVLLQP